MPRAGPRAKLTGMEPTEVTSGDTIRLVLPAEPGYGRIARIAASRAYRAPSASPHP